MAGETNRARTPRQTKRTSPAPLSEDGRLQPQALELEEAVIGACMIERDAFGMISDYLKPESFYDTKHQKIFAAIRDLAAENNPVDILTVTEQLRKTGDLELVGGPVAITELSRKVLSSAHIEYHARIIAQKALARELITYSSNIQRQAFDDSQDIAELMQQAEGQLFELSKTNMKKDFTQINPVIKEAYTMLQKAAARTDGLSGLTSGFKDIDRVTSGWQNSDLIIIAARPAMGKTAFVLSMARNMAVDHKIPVAMFSLEMSNVQLVNRLIVNVCEIPGEKIKSGQLAPYEWEQLDTKITELVDAPLYIDDTPSLSVFELRTKARRLVREHKVQMIIIDYLQLMNASGMSYNSRQEEVSTISRSLKGLAKELNIPQDADLVAFIHRPEYYKIFKDQYGNDLKGVAEFIIAKHRNGSVEDVKMRFVGQYARFLDLHGNSFDDNLDDGLISSSNIKTSTQPTTEPTPDDGGFDSLTAADFTPQNDVPF